MTSPQHPQFDPVAFARLSTIQLCFDTCVKLFNSGIFGADGVGTPLFEAAVVNLLINLNDLMQKAAGEGKRITSTEHVNIVKGINDVTDLVSKCRNAVCHIGSPLQDIGTNRFRLISFAGKSPAAMTISGQELGSDFEDDIAVFYGEYRLYLRRHVMVSMQKLEVIFADELGPNWRQLLTPKI